LVLEFDRLPSLPGVAIKLIEAIQKPEPDIREVIKLISSDTTLSAKILPETNIENTFQVAERLRFSPSHSISRLACQPPLTWNGNFYVPGSIIQ
jgi:hypothetical protein